MRTPIEIIEDILADIALVDPKDFIEDGEPGEELQPFVHPIPATNTLRALRVVAVKARDEASVAKGMIESLRGSSNEASAVKSILRAAMLDAIYHLCLYHFYGLWGKGKIADVSKGRIVWFDFDFRAKSAKDVRQSSQLWIESFLDTFRQVPNDYIRPFFVDVPNDVNLLGILSETESDTLGRKLVTLTHDAIAQKWFWGRRTFLVSSESEHRFVKRDLDRAITVGNTFRRILDYYFACRFNHWRYETEFEIYKGWKIVANNQGNSETAAGDS